MEIATGRKAENGEGRAEPATLSASARWWIWGFPIAFMVHDGEEVLAILRAGELRSVGAPLTVAEGLAAILFELALFWLLSVLAVWSGRPGWPMRFFGLALVGYTLHGVMHLVAGIVGTGYVFGATTALPAVIVYGGLAIYRLHAERLLTRKELVRSVAAAVVLGPPFLYLVHSVGRIIG